MLTGLTAPTAKRSFPSQALRPPRATSAIDCRAARALQAKRLPLQRVAALLSAISHNNSNEGRDPAIIPDSLMSGFVAELVGMTISALADSLIRLQHLGLVAPVKDGALRLLDRPALERLIDAH